MSDRIQVYLDEFGEWRWRRKAANGEIVADSGEGYTRRAAALKAAWRERAEGNGGPQEIQVLEPDPLEDDVA